MSTSRLSVESGAPMAQVKSSASTASAFNYPRGHLGYLTPLQEEALQKFKALVEEHGIWKRGPPASHTDQTLIRYLRARRWVPKDAYTQFKDTEEWRAANNIDTLYRTIDVNAYDESRRLYPQWTGRRDRRGIPLYLFKIQGLDSKTIAAYEKSGANSTFSDAETDGKTPNGLLRLFALYENLIHFSQPFCTQLQDRESADVPVTMSTNIVDISGVGLKQFWNLKGHMQAASQLATAHYPETLDRIFIIGAPMFFSTVWGWIKRWFDPITVSKIFILGSHEVKPVLESFIDPRNIPTQYGGELDFKFGDLPTVDPAWEGVIEWQNGYTAFPTGPLLWEETEGDEKIACFAVGAKDGKKIHEHVCFVPKTWHHPIDDEPQVAEELKTNGDANAVSESTQTDDTTQDESTQTGEEEAMEKLHIADERPQATAAVSA